MGFGNEKDYQGKKENTNIQVHNSKHEAKRVIFVKKFTGHASTITNVVFGPNDDICVSIAENDRYVNVWDCSSQSEDSGNITALTMDTDIVHVDVSSTDNTVLALSEDGLVGIWQNASSPTSASAASSGPKSKRKIRSTTRQPDSSIKVVSSEDESSTIPILLTAFMSGSDKDFVIIARGSTLKPSFEIVVCVFIELILLNA